jgi:hypothetical protein
MDDEDLMSDKRQSKEEVPTRTANDVIDTARDNTIRTIDEAAKVHPQYSQSVSNLQSDYIQTTKNIVQTAFANQKQIAQSLNLPGNPQVSELIARQSTELTNNLIRGFGIYNQLALNAIDTARENAKIYSRTIDAMTEYSANVFKAWTNYLTAQQQQFNRAY